MKKGSFALRLFLYASLVSLVWLGGYMVLSKLFFVEEPGRKAEGAPTPIVQLPESTAKQWSVLAVTDEEGEVTDFWLRYGDFRADVLVFIQIPVDTKVELAAGGYEVLKVYNPELPKLFMVSDVCRFFSKETMCMAVEEAGTALLGVRPAESYIIDGETYSHLIKREEGRIYFVRPESMEETIEDVVSKGITNDTAEAELVYWESYADLECIYYLKLPGRDGAQEYMPDGDKIAEMMNCLEMGEYDRLEPLYQERP